MSGSRIPDGHVQITINLPEEQYLTIKANARALDLTMSSWIRGVLAGAIAQGRTDNLVHMAINTKLIVPTKYQRSVVGWKSNGKGRWENGPFTLLRKGLGSRFHKPGDGWYLHGASSQPIFCGHNTKDARDLASSIINSTPQHQESA